MKFYIGAIDLYEARKRLNLPVERPQLAVYCSLYFNLRSDPLY